MRDPLYSNPYYPPGTDLGAIGVEPDPTEWYVEGLSDCCGVKVAHEDICTDCKEHCGIII